MRRVSSSPLLLAACLKVAFTRLGITIALVFIGLGYAFYNSYDRVAETAGRVGLLVLVVVVVSSPSLGPFLDLVWLKLQVLLGLE